MNMGGNAAVARSVEEAVSASMGGNAVNARSAEEAVSVSTGGSSTINVRLLKGCSLPTYVIVVL